MEIFNHTICETVIGKPSDMNDEECRPLPVHYEQTDSGLFAVSFWEPTKEDITNILAGHVIALWVRAPGRQHPVVALSTFPKVM